MAFTFDEILNDWKSFDFADRICEAAERFPRGYGFLVDPWAKLGDIHDCVERKLPR